MMSLNVLGIVIFSSMMLSSYCTLYTRDMMLSQPVSFFGKCLTVGHVQVLSVQSLTGCASSCLSHGSCLSFNFDEDEGYGLTCTLFNVTSSSNTVAMLPNPGCKYYESVPGTTSFTTGEPTTTPAVTTPAISTSPATTEQPTTTVAITTPVITTTLVTTAPPCPGDYRYFNGSCYLIPINSGVGVKKSWHNARAHCQGDGGDLAIIETLEENNFARQYHLDNYAAMPAAYRGNKAKGIWLALYEPTQYNWQWERAGNPSRLVSTGLQYWTPLPEANNNNEDCGGLWPYDNYTWVDGPCSFTFWFLCEKQA